MKNQKENQTKEREMGKQIVVVNYGTIKDLKVELPVEACAMDILKGFAEAYFNYATKRALVSDEVLFHSIGATYVREAMVEGTKERLNAEIPERVKEEIIRLLKDDEAWKNQILITRYGWEKAMVKIHGKEIAQRIIAAV